MMSDRERLERCIRARHGCVFIPTFEEEEARRLAAEVALAMGRDLRVWSVDAGVANGLVQGSARGFGGPAGGSSGGAPGTEHPAAAMYHLAQTGGPGLIALVDVVEHLGDARTLRQLRVLIERQRDAGGAVILIDHKEALPAVVSSIATRFELSLPDERELESILKATVRRAHQERPVEAVLSRAALAAIVRNLRGLNRREAQQMAHEMLADDSSLSEEDVNTVMARKRQLLHRDGALEFVEAPTSLDDVGGLKALKQWLLERRDAAGEEAARFGLTPPRGVLLLGVQGAGKSLSAKAIATARRAPLLRMDPTALYDRFVGESERRLREALRQAEMMAPIVLWIDEIEKGFASAASHSTDGGLSKRMFGALLTWMQDHRSTVFLVATANDIEALPPELLRKGRFDEIFFVDLPGEEARRVIFEIHLSKRGRDAEKFDLERLARASEGFSGAEIEQAVVSALHLAFGAKREVTAADVERALRASPPLSVTMAERVADLRAWAEGRCRKAE